MRPIIAAVTGWVAGLAAYVLVGVASYRQRIGAADLAAMAFWSALILSLVAPLLFGPILVFASRRVQSRALVALTLGAAGLIPTMMLVVLFHGRFLSPEAVMSGILFMVSGAVFGAVAYRR